MAQRLMSFPMILWEVQNVLFLTKQTSSTFSFLGGNWQLHLHHCSGSRGKFIQIFLKRIESDTEINYFLCAKTSLIINDATSNFETLINLDPLEKEWCVWDKNTNEVTPYLPMPAQFLCCIQPRHGWKEILDKHVDKGLKLSEVNADIEGLREDLRNLFDKHVEADVIFNCKGEKIYAHRAMLSSRCKVLAAMFQADMKESRERVIDITDTEPFILRLFLRYLYTEDLPRLSLNSSMKLYFLADKYGMDILKKNCAFFMLDNLEVDISDGSSESSDEENLTMKIRTRLRNIRKVLYTDNWKLMNEEQLKMSLDAFHGFVKGIYSELYTTHETDVKLLNSEKN